MRRFPTRGPRNPLYVARVFLPDVLVAVVGVLAEAHLGTQGRGASPARGEMAMRMARGQRLQPCREKSQGAGHRYEAAHAHRPLLAPGAAVSRRGPHQGERFTPSQRGMQRIKSTADRSRVRTNHEGASPTLTTGPRHTACTRWRDARDGRASMNSRVLTLALALSVGTSLGGGPLGVQADAEPRPVALQWFGYSS